MYTDAGSSDVVHVTIQQFTAILVSRWQFISLVAQGQMAPYTVFMAVLKVQDYK